MRVGVYMPAAERTLRDLVIGRLARETGLQVVALDADRGISGSPGIASCGVVVFTADDQAPGIEQLCSCIGLRCVELRDGGRLAIAWRVRAEQRSLGAMTPDLLVEAVRAAVADARAP